MTGECIWWITLTMMRRILSRVTLWMEPSICKSLGITGLSQDDFVTLVALIVWRAEIATVTTELQLGRRNH